MISEDPESQDPAWLLLQKARPVKARPQFSRQVLEAVRREAQRETDHRAWLRGLWTPATRPAWLAAAAALVVTGWWAAHRPDHSGPSATAATAATGTPADPADGLADEITSELAMIDEVDDLLAPESAQDLGEEDIERLLF